MSKIVDGKKVSTCKHLYLTPEKASEFLTEYMNWLKTKPKIEYSKFTPFKQRAWRAWPGSKNPCLDAMFDSRYLKKVIREEPLFTPGEWKPGCMVDPETGCDCTYVLSGIYFGAVCTINWSETRAIQMGDNPPYWQAVANSYLIASAPKLFTELKRLDPNNPVLREALGYF